MKRINSRSKGARGERQWRDELRANGYQARRGQQFTGSPDSPDVVCPDLAGIHFEVKAVERLNIYEAFAQASRDARRGDLTAKNAENTNGNRTDRTDGADRTGKIPIVAHRRNFWPWLVTMEASVLFNGADGFLNGSSHFVQPTGQRINLHDLVDQASRDAGERPAFVCHQRGDCPRLVTMAAETFFGLLAGRFAGISNFKLQISKGSSTANDAKHANEGSLTTDGADRPSPGYGTAGGMEEMEGIHGKWEIGKG